MPALMEVESYAVHSLVSTVRGQRRPQVSTADCLRATFPGGSMTGAPKLRSMQILDRWIPPSSLTLQWLQLDAVISGCLGSTTVRLPVVWKADVLLGWCLHQYRGHHCSGWCRLEGEARGIYSGSLGFMSFNGAFDLNIVIRTAILSGDRIKIGAGGAIVVQSDPCDEYEEMRLKANALLTAIGRAEGSSVAPDVDEGSA